MLMNRIRSQQLFVLAILASGCFFSCMVGKNYQQPALDMPGQYRNGKAGEDSSSIAKMPWKTFFSDTTLEQLIDSAVSHNYDLQLAIKNIETAAQMLHQARLGQLPQVDLTVSATSNIPSKNSLNGFNASAYLGTDHYEDYNIALGLSWEADIWGKIKRKKLQAYDQFLQSAEVKKAVQTQLVAEVAAGYYNLLMLDKQMEVAQESYVLDDSTLSIIKLEYDAGQTNALAVEQANAQVDAAALLIPQTEQAIALQEDALRVLQAELPSAIHRPSKLDQFQIPEEYATGIPVQLVSLRPDVRASELALRAANEAVGIAKANLYPSLVIGISGGFDTYLFGEWLAIPASLFGTAAGSLTQPIFHQDQLKTQYKLAEIDREKSVIDFRKSVLVAVGEVSDALVKMEKLKTQEQIASQRADTLQNATRNASLLYKSGMANYLEVITAQATALQSQLDVADLKRQRLDALVELYRSLGGGWQ
jgi:NodT family efflux transporter outer membrane factor (OMF) lipoprotein